MPEAPDLVRQPQPLGRSILWRPATDSGPLILHPDPIFVAQAAVIALREHVGAAAGAGVLGVLIGDLCDGGVGAGSDRYILISSILRASQTVQADRTTIVLKTMWDQVRDQLKATQGRLLGWYHTHADAGIEMSSYDVEAHERYFRDPWQVALVVGAANGQPAAGFFRKSADDAWVTTLFPFYEIQKEESAGEGGKKRSYVVWKNYKAYSATIAAKSAKAAPRPPAAARPAPPPPPPPPLPEPELEEEKEEEPADEAEESVQSAPPGKDGDELRFLSAAEDAPPPAPTPAAAPARAAAPSPEPPQAAPPSPPPAPPPAPVPQAPTPMPSRTGAVQGLVADGALVSSQEMVALPPLEPEPPVEASGPRRRISRAPRAGRRGLGGMVLPVVIAVLVAGGWLAYRKFGRQLWSNPVIANEIAQLRDLVMQRLHRAAAPPAPGAPAPPPAPAVTPPVPGAQPVAHESVPPPPAAPPSPALLQLDQLADSLSQALTAYQDRLRLFDNRQLDCAGLGRGLVTVESRHAAYTAQSAVGGVALDAARAARQQALRVAFDSAEQRFQLAHCTRP